MGEVTYNEQKSLYEIEVKSQATNTTYTVTLNPVDYSFSCSCPAYKYSKDKHCKHISMYGDGLSDYVDNLQPTAGGDKTKSYRVSINDSPSWSVDRETMLWLVDSLPSNQQLSIVIE